MFSKTKKFTPGGEFTSDDDLSTKDRGKTNSSISNGIVTSGDGI